MINGKWSCRRNAPAIQEIVDRQPKKLSRSEVVNIKEKSSFDKKVKSVKEEMMDKKVHVRETLRDVQ